MFSEWALAPTEFRRLEEAHGSMLEIDLFASPLNFKIPQYVARFNDPQAIAQDALTLCWNQWSQIYVFPPFSLIPEVTRKLESYTGGGLLVVLDSKEHRLLLPHHRVSKIIPLILPPAQLVQGELIYAKTSSDWIALSF